MRELALSARATKSRRFTFTTLFATPLLLIGGALTAVTVAPTARAAAPANTAVTTYRNDNSRDGQYSSEAILNTLYDLGERREQIYEHVWQLGDLLMWDNRCTIHARTDFPKGERRLLRRCTVEGEPLHE